jgi:hypothetical protein
MFDPKSLAASIVKGDDPELPEVGEATESSTDELAAEDVMAAFQENDPKALAAALRAFISAAEAGESPAVEAAEE